MKSDTLALLVAGRSLDEHLVTRGMLARLREEYGVRGEEVARVSNEGYGAIALAPEMLEGDLLLAVYDG